MGRFLPPAASSHAAGMDAMLLHVHWMVIGLFAGWAIYFLYVLLRYRAGRNPRAFREGTRETPAHRRGQLEGTRSCYA